MSAIRLSAESVVAEMVKAGNAETIARDALVTAESLYIDAALYLDRAVTSGAQIAKIALLATAAITADPRLSETVYASKKTIGAYRRVGQIFALETPAILPTDVTARGVMSLVNNLPVGTVDYVIGLADTIADAVTGLQAAASALAAAKVKADKLKSVNGQDAAKTALEAPTDNEPSVPGIGEDVKIDALPIDRLRFASAEILRAMVDGAEGVECEAILAEIRAMVALPVTVDAPVAIAA